VGRNRRGIIPPPFFPAPLYKCRYHRATNNHYIRVGCLCNQYRTKATVNLTISKDTEIEKARKEIQALIERGILKDAGYRGGDNIKAELQKSGNVKSVDIHGDEAVNINAVEELVTVSITLTEDGYGFEVLRSKYPNLRIQDIYHDDEGIQVKAEYRRPTE